MVKTYHYYQYYVLARFHRFGLWGRNVVLDAGPSLALRSHCTAAHLIRGADSDTDEKVGTCLCRSRSMPPRRPADEIKPLYVSPTR